MDSTELLTIKSRYFKKQLNADTADLAKYKQFVKTKYINKCRD